MQNSAYNIVSESVILTETALDKALTAGAGGYLAASGRWAIIAANKARKCYKVLKSVQTKEEAISVLNNFYSDLKLDATKLNDPKEITLWKTMWSRRAQIYEVLYDDGGELSQYWKEKLLHRWKLSYISLFVTGTAMVGLGGTALASLLRK